MRKQLLAALTAALLLGTSATAAAGGSLTISGAAAVQPLAGLLAKAYNLSHPDDSIAFYFTDGVSATGIADAAVGRADIGTACRGLRPAEIAYGLVATTIARDAVAIVVNPANPVDNLTSAQAAAVFAGRLTNWSQLGGHDAPIHINAYTAADDTADYFNEYFCGGSAKLAATASQWDSGRRLRQAVAADPNAIGFLSVIDLDGSVKAPDLDGQAVSLAAAKAGAYQAVRNLNMITRGQPAGNAKLFLDWVLGAQGQALVTADYLPPGAEPAAAGQPQPARAPGHQRRQPRH